MTTTNDETMPPPVEQVTPPTPPTHVQPTVPPFEPSAHSATAVTEVPAADPAPAPDPVAAVPSAETPPPMQAVEGTVPAPAPTPAPEPARADDGALFEQAMAKLEQGEDGESYKKLSKGDRVEATVIQVENDRVFVDLGTKSEGVVPLAELTEENLETAHGHVKAGDKIQVVVIRPEGAEGNAIVSKKRAEFEETWTRIIGMFEQGTPITAPVIDRVKGGLLVDIGVRGFVPATHVGNGRIRNIDKFVGQTLELKILEIDRERKKVVLSNRAADEEKRANVRERIFQDVSPGDILEGTVRRLLDYGAFVDLGGIDGLLHISEMSWMRINHPREVLKEGQKISVMVLRLDPGNSKISLGLRQVLPDPWNLIKQNYKIGQKITCTISRLVQVGAFVKLPEGAEAFLPVSEISSRRIQRPSDVLEEGQEVEAVIHDLRPDERRMVLSLRGGTVIEPPVREGGGGRESGGDEPEWRGRRDGGKPRGGGGGKPRGGRSGGGRGGRMNEDDDFDVPVVGRIPTGGATIGERLGLLKGLTLREGDEHEEELDDVASESDTTEVEEVVETVESPAVVESEAAPDSEQEKTE